MNRHKEASAGVFASFGRAIDESIAMAMAAGSGKMRRADLDEWWKSRRTEAREMMVSLQERAPDLRRPVEALLDVGKEIVKKGAASAAAVAAPRIRRRRSLRRGKSARASAGAPERSRWNPPI